MLEPLLENGADGADGDLSAAEAGGKAGRKEGKKMEQEKRRACCDAYMPATLAAILCLWVLKLTQQGYLDGLSIFTGPLFGARLQPGPRLLRVMFSWHGLMNKGEVSASGLPSHVCRCTGRRSRATWAVSASSRGCCAGPAAGLLRGLAGLRRAEAQSRWARWSQPCAAASMDGAGRCARTAAELVVRTAASHTPCGSPPVTRPCAGWDASDVGSLIAVLGLASIPVSFAVGAASARVSDRALTAAALVSGVAGCALLTQAGHVERSSAYFAGAAPSSLNPKRTLQAGRAAGAGGARGALERLPCRRAAQTCRVPV